MFCNHCGAPVEDGSQFCFRCGAGQPETAALPEEMPPAAAPVLDAFSGDSDDIEDMAETAGAFSLSGMSAAPEETENSAPGLKDGIKENSELETQDGIKSAAAACEVFDKNEPAADDCPEKSAPEPEKSEAAQEPLSAVKAAPPFYVMPPQYLPYPQPYPPYWPGYAVPQYPPYPPPYASPYPPQYHPYPNTVPQTAYSRPQNSLPPPYGEKQPQKASAGKAALIAVITLLAVGAFFAGMLLILNAVRGVAYQPYPEGNSPAAPPANTAEPGMTGSGYLTYETLLDDYFTMFESGDSSRFQYFVHESAKDLLTDMGVAASDYASELDIWTEDYGSRVLLHDIDGIYPYDNEAYVDLCDFLGIERASLEQYIDVAVDVEYHSAGDRHSELLDFDLMKVDGAWYIVEVW